MNNRFNKTSRHQTQNQAQTQAQTQTAWVLIPLVLLTAIMLAFTMGATAFAGGGHTHDGITFDQEMTATPSTGITYDGETNTANVYLADNVTLTEDFTIPAGKILNLCLNGHVLKGKDVDENNAFEMITVEGTLNLYDCDTATVHHFNENPTIGMSDVYLWEWDKSESAPAHTVTGGVITGGCVSKAWSGDTGACIIIKSGGTMNMHGGNLVGNYCADYGGAAIFNTKGGTLTISGGTIQGNCQSNTAAAAVNSAVKNAGTMSMTAGTIANNACAGIGVAKGHTGTTISGSSIILTKNITGICVSDTNNDQASGNTNISNCSITNNLSRGLDMFESTAKVSGVTISGNECYGVCCVSSTLEIDACTITGNGGAHVQNEDYCGVYNYNSAITLKGAVNITGNKRIVLGEGAGFSECDSNLYFDYSSDAVTLVEPSANMKVGVTFENAPVLEYPQVVTNAYGTTSYASCFTSDDPQYLTYAEKDGQGKYTIYYGAIAFDDRFGWNSYYLSEANAKYTASQTYNVTDNVSLMFMGWSTECDDVTKIDTVLQGNRQYYAIWKNPTTEKIVRTQRLVFWSEENQSDTNQGWSFEITENSATLTIDGLMVMGPDAIGNYYNENPAIDYRFYDRPLTVIVKGTNVLGFKNSLEDLADSYSNIFVGIKSGSDAVFSGDGELTIYDFKTGIDAGGDITISKDFSGTMTIFDSGSTPPQQWSCALKADGDITIAGGTIDLYNDKTDGIHAEGSFTYEGGSVTTRGNGHAIFVGEEGSFSVCDEAIIAANENWDGTGDTTKVTPSVSEEGVVTGFETAKYIKLSLPEPPEPPTPPEDDPEDDPVDDPKDEPIDDPADDPKDDPADNPGDNPADEPKEDTPKTGDATPIAGVAFGCILSGLVLIALRRRSIQ